MNAILLVVAVLVIAGGAFFVLKSKKQQPPTQPSQEPKPTPKPKPEVKKPPLPQELQVLNLSEAEIKNIVSSQIKEAQANLGVDESLIKELYENELISQLENSKDEFYHALENKDYDTLEKVAHSLKGAAQNLGIKVVGDILQTIVNKTRAKEELEEIKIYVDAVYKLLPKLRVN